MVLIIVCANDVNFWFMQNIVQYVARQQPNIFMNQHLHFHDLYDVRFNDIIDNFISKCPEDLIIVLRYEVELGETLTGEMISQLYNTYKRDYSLFDIPCDFHLP